MNIFVLDKNPEKCAAYHCDKHVVKMIVETAQMLCTAHWVCGSCRDTLMSCDKNNSALPPNSQDINVSLFSKDTAFHANNGLKKIPYKPTHINHPCNIWVRESLDNYEFLCKLGLALCGEYTKRYGKIHKTQEVIEWAIENKPVLPRLGLTKFAQAMPEEYRGKSAVKAYRDYYVGEKKRILSYKNGVVPRFLRK